MPELSGDIARKVDEGGGTAAVEDGVYEVELIEVEARPGRVAPYWCWIFEIPSGEGREYAGRRFWHNTSLSEQALWKVAETFEAFGVPATGTNTDDLIGRRVKILVSRKVIEEGKRAGQIGNNVDAVMSVNQATLANDAAPGTADPWASVPATAEGSGKPRVINPQDEPNF